MPPPKGLHWAEGPGGGSVPRPPRGTRSASTLALQGPRSAWALRRRVVGGGEVEPVARLGGAAARDPTQGAAFGADPFAALSMDTVT